MTFLASVPVLLTLVALLYFVSVRILDHLIRSAEREYGARNDQNLWIPGGRTFPQDDLQGTQF